MFNTETLADALLARAEFCDGTCPPPNYDDIGCPLRFVYDAIENVFQPIGLRPFVADPDIATWQSLITRELVITGDL